MSTVYVLTNDSMPGFVKIGRTSGSIEKRMRDLYKTGVPIPFNCFYAVNVKDSDFVERKIHEASEMRCKPSGVRAPVDSPPWSLQRPLCL